MAASTIRAWLERHCRGLIDDHVSTTAHSAEDRREQRAIDVIRRLHGFNEWIAVKHDEDARARGNECTAPTRHVRVQV